MDLRATTPEAVLASIARTQLKGVASLTEWTCLGTRPGPTRASNGNQDRVLCASWTDRNGEQADAFVVCDGIGGMADGGRCAEVAIAAFLLALAARLSVGNGGAARTLHDAVEVANRRLFVEYGGHGGTTLACVLSYRHEALACSVGDSRIFEIDDAGFKQIGVDDTMRAALAAAGHADFDTTPEHDKLIQFIGMGPELRAHVSPIRDRERLRFVLLCTDGAYRLPGDAFARIVGRATTSKQLVDRLLHVSDWLGGTDDASAVAVSGSFLGAVAKDESARGPAGSTSTLLRVWGVCQLGQPAMLWLDPRAELSRDDYHTHGAPMERSRRPAEFGAPTRAQSVDQDPTRKRGNKNQKKRRQSPQETLRAPDDRVDAQDDVIIQVTAPADPTAPPLDQRVKDGRDVEPAPDRDDDGGRHERLSDNQRRRQGGG